MKSYRSGDELMRILLANGYKEAKQSHAHGSCNPMSDARNFALFKTNVTSQTPLIQLKQGAIKENCFQFYAACMEERHLQAMVCFHKLSGGIRNTIRNKFRHAWQIQSVTNFFDELRNEDSAVSKHISKALRRKILTVYETVALG